MQQRLAVKVQFLQLRKAAVAVLDTGRPLLIEGVHGAAVMNRLDFLIWESSLKFS